jgi:hypothetical protein
LLRQEFGSILTCSAASWAQLGLARVAYGKASRTRSFLNKAQFINHVLKQGAQMAEVGEEQESCTSEVTPMQFELDGCKGSIIDTPGFDDTRLTETQILEKIANWMEIT